MWLFSHTVKERKSSQCPKEKYSWKPGELLLKTSSGSLEAKYFFLNEGWYSTFLLVIYYFANKYSSISFSNDRFLKVRYWCFSRARQSQRSAYTITKNKQKTARNTDGLGLSCCSARRKTKINRLSIENKTQTDIKSVSLLHINRFHLQSGREKNSSLGSGWLSLFQNPDLEQMTRRSRASSVVFINTFLKIPFSLLTIRTISDLYLLRRKCGDWLNV